MSLIDLDDLASALSDQERDHHEWFLDPATGDVVPWVDDAGQGVRQPHPGRRGWIPIDALPSHLWYEDMADFAEGIADEQAGRELGTAIQGPGAFRRFKDALHQHHPDLVPLWYAFRDARARRRAVQWLLDTALVDGEEALDYLAEHVDPDLGRPRSGVAARWSGVTVDCRDPAGLADYWAFLLDGEVSEPLPGWWQVVPGQADGVPLLTFQPAEHPLVQHERGRTLLRLDLVVDNLEAAVSHASQRGGQILDQRHEPAGSVVLMADPEGHEFRFVHYHH